MPLHSFFFTSRGKTLPLPFTLYVLLVSPYDMHMSCLHLGFWIFVSEL